MSASAIPDSPHGFEAFQSTRRFNSLDGLRCLSIVAVIWHHGPGLSLDGVGGRGYMGVPLFFAISGFLITTLLLREKSRHGRVAMRKFYIRRSLRIFPLYYAVLAVYVVMMGFAAPSAAQSAHFYGNLPYFLTYTSNWFVGKQGTFSFVWSLAAEEQFYASWPWVVRRFTRTRAALLMSAILVLLVVWHQLFSLSQNASFPLVVLHNVPMAICWGCLAACVLDSRRGFQFAYPIFGRRWMPIAILALVLVMLQIVDRGNSSVVNFLLAALVVSCVIREDHLMAPLLQLRGVVHLGAVSYGMYLLHGLVYVAQGRAERAGLIHWDAHGLFGFLIALVVVSMIATLSFRFFEGPFLQLKRRFAA